MKGILIVALIAGWLSAPNTQAAETSKASQRRVFQDMEAQLKSAKDLRGFEGIPESLLDYPLTPYLDALVFQVQLRHRLSHDDGAINTFLARHADAPVARALRKLALDEAERRNSREDFLARIRFSEASVEQQCRALIWRWEKKPSDVTDAELLSLWQGDQSLPSVCAALNEALRVRAVRTPERVWERARAGARAGRTGLLRELAPLLENTSDKTALQFWADAAGDLPRALTRIPNIDNKSSLSEGAAFAFARLARRNPAGAIALWPKFENALPLDDRARGIALNPLALQRAASYESDAGVWLNRVPESGYDDKLREWRVRTALFKNDHAAALIAVEKMPAPQNNDPRWRYLRARLLQVLAKPEAARELFQSLAKETNFFGFLAADQIAAPYSICPVSGTTSSTATPSRMHPAIERSLEWHALGRLDDARREWAYGFAQLSPEAQRQAVQQANAVGWLDRGPLNLLGEIHRNQYELRFPFVAKNTIEREAKHHALDPSFIAGLIRSESAWQHDVVSHANAWGLMQLIPATAERVARSLRKPWSGPRDLFTPEYNIALGTAHLAELMASHNNRAADMLAAYNAGPGALARWKARTPAMPIDLFIETIPYQETREYIARVTAFSTIYDWRWYGHAKPLSQRLGLTMPKRASNRVAFVCETTSKLQP